MYVNKPIYTNARGTFIRGFVYYKNNCIAKNSLVVVDKMSLNGSYELYSYTKTNEYGEFMVYIQDKDSYYKIYAYEI